MKIFISRKILDSGIKLLESHGAEIVCWDERTPINKQQLIENCKDADALISMLADPIDKEFIDACPKLKVITNYAVGYNNIDVEYATKRGICIGNTPEVLTDSTADTAFALLISTARRVVEAVSSVPKGEWLTWEPMGFIGQSLKGKTIGIIGMGRIGQAMAKRCHGGFDMKVLYTANSNKPEAEKTLGATKVDLETLIRESDYISLHCPLTPETKNLLDYESFKKMKKSAILINTARGDVIVQDDLIKALRDGEIWGAGLDVTTPEPLPLDNPLHSMTNVTILPHIGSADIESRETMSNLCANNILAGLKGEPLPAFVNPEVQK